jgi:peptide/nickel transport system permease protein
MKTDYTRTAAIGLLILTGVFSLGADVLTCHDAGTQFRDRVNEGPSTTFPLGTDELGRDRWSRLLHASRVSLLCAPAAAAAAIGIAVAVGLAGGWLGGWADELATSMTELVLSLPWLFLLLTLRAVLPLNITPWASIAVTFLLLAATGWAPGARLVRATVVDLRDYGPVRFARACGYGRSRILAIQVLPCIKPILVAQFWILVPVFLLAEANLGMLGLGVTEPMPSWGNMLSELRHYDRIPDAPWILAPALLLALVVASLHVLMAGKREWE